jgi:hypothetical protein
MIYVLLTQRLDAKVHLLHSLHMEKINYFNDSLVIYKSI